MPCLALLAWTERARANPNSPSSWGPDQHCGAKQIARLHVFRFARTSQGYVFTKRVWSFHLNAGEVWAVVQEKVQTDAAQMPFGNSDHVWCILGSYSSNWHCQVRRGEYDTIDTFQDILKMRTCITGFTPLKKNCFLLGGWNVNCLEASERVLLEDSHEKGVR